MKRIGCQHVSLYALEPMTSRFTEAVQAAMKQKGVVSVRDVADRCDAQYEMVRRVVLVEIIPSKYLFGEVCKALRLNEAEMEKLWLQDKVEARYGKAGAILAGRNPEIQ